MSKFDLSTVQLAAKEQQEHQESSQQYKYKLQFPQNGTISIRVLFNPKSGLVMTSKYRHTIGNEKINCLKNYNQDCPLCQAIEEASSVTGADLWKLKSNARYIFLAQYVASDYQWDPKYPEPSVGDVLLMMVPWTVYSELQRLIAQSGDNVTSILTDNVGLPVRIHRAVNTSQVKYSVDIDPFNKYQSCNTQEEFDSLLEGLDNITDMIVPKDINEEIINSVRLKAQSIRAEYLSGRVILNQSQPVQQGSNLGGMVSQFSQPIQQPVQQPPAQPVQSSIQPNPSSLFNGVDATMTPQQQPPAQPVQQSVVEQTKINPVTGQEYKLVNGEWVPTGNVLPTSFNGGV